MQGKTTWQQNSNQADNANHFATIRQWWAGLNGQEITWKQRLIAPMEEVSQLDWEPKKFDEKFVITGAEIRGITLYWQKPELKDERSTTPHKLEFDSLRQQLYIFPQSQKELVIQVGLPQLSFQTLKMNGTRSQVATVGSGVVLTLQDEAQQLEVQVVLNPAQLTQLRQQLG